MVERKTLEQQIAQTEARLHQMKQAAAAKSRKADNKAKIVLGGMVAAAMEDDADLRRRIVHLLGEKVTRPSDKEAVARWLVSPGE